MSTLLSRKPLPLWAYILIIVAGSLVVLVIAAFIIRSCLSRRRANRAPLQPMRRVTVRRGRVVPASHYLSLTGSKFGMGLADDHEISRTRSRSPFEWWNNVVERSHSRQDDLSQAETGSIGGGRSSVKSASLYTRKDLSASTHTLPTDGRDKDWDKHQEKEPFSSMRELDQSSEPDTDSVTVESPSQTINVDRPSMRRIPTSPLALHNRALSRIEEASPHHSMISSLSTQRPSSKLSGNDVLDSNSTAPEGRHTSIHSSRRSSKLANASTTSIPETASQRTQDGALQVPRPIAYRGSRSSLGEVVPPSSTSRSVLSHKSSNIPPRHSKADPINVSRPDSRDTTIGSEQSTRSGLWAGSNLNRSNSRTINRTPSKKGNVLRKKSLRRAEIISLVDA